MNNLRSRRGKLIINREVYDNQLNELSVLFKWLEFIPLHSESRFDLNALEVIGLSPRFIKVPEGVEAVEYAVLFAYDGGKVQVSISAGYETTSSEFMDVTGSEEYKHQDCDGTMSVNVNQFGAIPDKSSEEEAKNKHCDQILESIRAFSKGVNK